MEQLSIYHQAIEYVVMGLLNRGQFDVGSKKIVPSHTLDMTPREALNAAIGHGGGHTIQPHIGDFWLAYYQPGPCISLIGKKTGDEWDEVKIPPSIAVKCATNYLNSIRNKQLTLFP